MGYEVRVPVWIARESRRSLLLASGLVAAAAAVRLATLARQPLWGDEGFSWSVAHASPKALLSPAFDDRNPVLYYLLIHPIVLWRPESEFWLRVPSALASLAFLGLIAALAWRWENPRAAPWAAFLAGASSFELLAAQDARAYAVLNLCWLGAVALILEGARRRAPGVLLLGAVLNALLPALHAVGIVAAAINLVVAIALVVREPALRGSRNVRLALLTGLVAIALSFAIFDAHLMATFEEGGASGATPSLAGVGDWLVAVGGGIAFVPSVAPGTGLRAPTPYWLGPLAATAVWCLALSGFVRRWRAGDPRRGLYAALAVTLVGPALVVALVGRILETPAWVPRLFSVDVAFLALGVATHVWSRGVVQRALIAIVVCGIALASWMPYFTTWRKDIGHDLRAATPRKLGARDAMVIDFGSAPLALFYFPSVEVWSVARDRAPSSADWVRRIQLGGPERAKLRRRAEPCAGKRVETLWIWPSAPTPEEARARLPVACADGRTTMAWDGHRWSPLR